VFTPVHTVTMATSMMDAVFFCYSIVLYSFLYLKETDKKMVLLEKRTFKIRCGWSLK